MTTRLSTFDLTLNMSNAEVDKETGPRPCSSRPCRPCSCNSHDDWHRIHRPHEGMGSFQLSCDTLRTDISATNILAALTSKHHIGLWSIMAAEEEDNNNFLRSRLKPRETCAKRHHRLSRYCLRIAALQCGSEVICCKSSAKSSHQPEADQISDNFAKQFGVNY